MHELQLLSDTEKAIHQQAYLVYYTIGLCLRPFIIHKDAGRHNNRVDDLFITKQANDNSCEWVALVHICFQLPADPSFIAVTVSPITSMTTRH
jgi:hypothetical protein